MTNHLSSIFQAIQLMYRIVSPAKETTVQLDTTQYQTTTANAHYLVLHPAKKPINTIILLHGFSYAGEQDRQFLQMVDAYLKQQFRVILPVLPHLKRFQFDPTDIDLLGSIINELYTESQQPVIIKAFSAGAGISLVTACRPEWAHMIDRLLLIGPYYTLDQLIHNFSQSKWADKRNSYTPKEWEDFVWYQLILSYRHREHLQLTQDQIDELTTLLFRYGEEDGYPDQSTFYKKQLAHRDIPNFSSLIPDQQTLATMSSQGKLQQVKADVYLCHGPDDPFVPASASEKILLELQQRPQGTAHLLITPIISHARPQFNWQLLDYFRIFAMMSNLFEPIK